MTAHEVLEKVRELVPEIQHRFFGHPVDLAGRVKFDVECTRCKLDAILASAETEPDASANSENVKAPSKAIWAWSGPLPFTFEDFENVKGGDATRIRVSSSQRTLSNHRGTHPVDEHAIFLACEEALEASLNDYPPESHERVVRLVQNALEILKAVLPQTGAEEQLQSAPPSLEVLAEKWGSSIVGMAILTPCDRAYAKARLEDAAELRATLSKQASADAVWNEAVEACAKVIETELELRENFDSHLEPLDELAKRIRALRGTRPASAGDKTSGVTDAPRDKGAGR